MPTSQSASERHTAGVGERLHRLVACRASKPSRMAGRHRLQPQPADRLGGLRVLDDVAEDELASRPASHALMSVVTSLRLMSFSSVFSRFSFFRWASARTCDGTAGRCAKVHLPRLTSSSVPRHPDLGRQAHRRRRTPVALEVVVVAREAAQRPRDVGGDGRFSAMIRTWTRAGRSEGTQIHMMEIRGCNRDRRLSRLRRLKRPVPPAARMPR